MKSTGEDKERDDQQLDIHPQETEEWLDSLDSVIDTDGVVRTRFLIARLLERARERNIGIKEPTTTQYINTIPPELEPEYPGDVALERRIRRIIRWNAAAMVTKANLITDSIGGHLSSFASSAMLYDVGFNHFFKGNMDGIPGDHVYFQGHAAPGIYARSFLEYRLDESDLNRFRLEIGGGLSSYPHPRLMPKYWEYPTVSMGLGPINSIYHARFLRYLANRDIEATDGSTVWCFLGDGEVDEPETLGSISLAARERLDNLTWVINCNLQRLDGPVRGNGQIIQELEARFRGAGWHVLKVIWGEGWDQLIAQDHLGFLLKRFNESLDGEYQRYRAEDGGYIREVFFGKYPQLEALVKDMTDDEIWNLKRGGLDYKKVYAAYALASRLKNAPTVILAKTVKGFMLGKGVQGANATHQVKRLSREQLLTLRDTLELTEDIPEEAITEEGSLPFFRPAPESAEAQYLTSQRAALGGVIPQRVVTTRLPLEHPGRKPFAEFDPGSGKIEISTTGVFTRLLRSLTRVPGFGSRVVPIIPDEGRTFGMDALFKELGIYSSCGQLYEPVDADLLLSYKEAKDGQVLQEGITEAGALSSWLAAATSYATRGVPMVPFYIFYSMFGFQRVGDLIWSAADSRARGFLLGATAGRTTLLGEGLQHQDGHSPVLASVVPVCKSYDPAFAYELATIIERGIHHMYRNNEDIFYYLTIYNEPYAHPPKPDDDDIDDQIMSGLYRWSDAPTGLPHKAAILFSGSTQRLARDAATELRDRYGVATELWSATSYKALREEALDTERWNRLHPDQASRAPYVTEALHLAGDSIVAVTDYMKAVPDQIGRWVPGRFTPLGTDGFGRSDTREALRRFFEIDTGHIVVAVLSGLLANGNIDMAVVKEALDHYDINPQLANPFTQ